ncbi:hypothetical protein AVEN_105488-1 [Araneus ventricosus]|uniref:CCHC-type domain-containing protein n=1 Tax=Araneus ventricosus TaxID=182803 RepID=A0A4Y2GLG0_ARAVE|nr:hypothetical protein AVEN_105488-1 [Araneus ventricosus]
MTVCRGKETCGRCSEIGHNSKSCTSTPKCSNCKAEHPSYSRKCPRWVEEREIQAIKVTQNISFAEARKIVTSRTPTVGVSYSSMASICPHCKNRTSEQAEAPPDNNPIPLSKNLQLNKIIEQILKRKLSSTDQAFQTRLMEITRKQTKIRIIH